MTTEINSPIAIASEMVAQADNIDRELDRGGKHEDDYAYAYGRMKAIVTYYCSLVRNLDPSTGLRAARQSGELDRHHESGWTGS